MAFVGEAALLDAHAPGDQEHGCASCRTGEMVHKRFAVESPTDMRPDVAALHEFGPDVTVIFGLPSVADAAPEALPGITLGVLTASLPPAGFVNAASVDRVVGFDPALTGIALGSVEVWRAIPPPVSDALFAEVRTWHRAPRAMSLGHSTEHREAMLTPAKHHHDLLQICHGVSGAPLAELCREYDVGVYVAREWGGGFGWQAAMHLASGQLLLTETLRPAHGLERNIDYLEIDSPEGLVDRLDRLLRFPEMSRSVRVRGRRKAEYFRASQVFARIAHDVLLDVAVFGSGRRGSP